MNSNYRCLLAGAMLMTAGFATEIKAQAFPAEISNWSEQEKVKQRKAGDELLVKLAAAVKAKKTSFNIPKGNYRFAKTQGKRPFHIQLLNVKNMTVEGNNSNFFFENQASGISIYKCSNLTVKNLYLDWDPVPFTQGIVTGLDEKGNSFTFKPDAGYEASCERIVKGSGLRGMLFDPKTRRMKPRQGGFCVDFKKKLGDGSYNIKVRGFYGAKLKACGFAKGDLIAMWHRKGRAVKVEVTEKITLENITLYSAPFIGYVENVGAGGNIYRKCRIVKRPGTNRLIGGNADGFNASNTLKGPTLDGCEIDTIGDDFVNFHGVYYRIFEQVSPTELVVQPFGSNGVKTPELTFLENKTWNSKGTRKCVSSKAFSYTIPDTSKKGLSHKWAAAKNFKPGSKVRAMRIKLDKPLKLDNPAIFSCASSVAAGAVIRNCKFTGSLARGIRYQSTDAVIENNDISLALGPLLSVTGQPGYWGEAVTSENLVVKNNVFAEGCLGARNRHPGVIEITAPGEMPGSEVAENIKFINNRIVNPGAAGIYLNNCKDIIIENNTIVGLGVIPEANGKGDIPAIIQGATENVKISNNKVEKSGKYASLTVVKKIK